MNIERMEEALDELEKIDSSMWVQNTYTMVENRMPAQRDHNSRKLQHCTIGWLNVIGMEKGWLSFSFNTPHFRVEQCYGLTSWEMRNIVLQNDGNYPLSTTKDRCIAYLRNLVLSQKNLSG